MLEDKLSSTMKEWAACLTIAESRALRRWRAPNPGFAEIQARLRGSDEGYQPRIDDLIDNIASAVNKGHLPFDVTAWRGIRSTIDAFPEDWQDLSQLVGRHIRLPGFLSTTVSEAVARDSFTNPSGAGGPALMRLELRSGVSAAWLPLVGKGETAQELELLLGPRRPILVTAVETDSDLTMIRGEVN